MIARVAAVFFVALGALTVVSPARADANCHYATQVSLQFGHARTHVHLVCKTAVSAPTENTLTQDSTSPVYANAGASASCVGAQLVLSVNLAFCHPTHATSPRTITPADLEDLVNNLPLPSCNLAIQPVHGRTLVNIRTNFYTDCATIRRNPRLLGQIVHLRIKPSTYTWRFGDTTQTTTTSPGAPYPDLVVTHQYTQPAHVHPSVTVTYAADYRLGQNTWQPVPGTATIRGNPTTLQVLTAHPELSDPS